MSLLAEALSALHAHADAALTLLEQLVRVNSHSGNVHGVNAVGTLLSDRLRGLPLDRTVSADAQGVAHLSFATQAAATEKSVLLIGHHDTVFPPGEFEGFEVRGDLAHGPGVLDMKGGLALIVQVLSALHDVGLLARLPIRFVSVGDEETGSQGSRALLAALAEQARCGLVFEAGRAGDAIITARRGSGQARVSARGRAAHAGNALAEGRSAIWALAKFVDRVLSDNGRIPGASVSVGIIAGGTARNTVPEQAAAELDLRFSDEAGKRAVEQLLADAAREATAEIDGTHIEIVPGSARLPWPRNAPSAALCARYAVAARAAGLGDAEAPLIGGGSDANTVGSLGLPTIDGLGPRGRGFHTKDEQVSLSSLPLKAEALLRFLLTELTA